MADMEGIPVTEILSPKEAVERVREADAQHAARVRVVGTIRGNPQAYDDAKREELAAWRERQTARRFLRQHIRETYGEDVVQLHNLSQG